MRVASLIVGSLLVSGLAATVPGCGDDTGPGGGAAGTTTTGATGTTPSTNTATTSSKSAVTNASSSTGAGSAASDLPIPPGPDDLPVPTGAPGNLRVLAWAGFTAAVSYTFDDGQPSHIEHWPAIKATGAPVTWYITTGNAGIPGYAEMFMDAYASGSEIGNHTAHHCHFDEGCSGQPAGSHEAELDDADAYIQQTLGVAPGYTMAYPFGDTGYRDAAMSRYFIVRGTPGGMIAPSDDTDPYNLPTFAAQGEEPASVFEERIDAARDEGRWLTLLFHAILPTDQNWYAGVDVGSITDSIAHAQMAGDVWLGTVMHVGAYWMGQKLVEEAETTTAGETTTLTWTLSSLFPRGRFVRVTVDGGTVSQDGVPLTWNGHGYYEVALDAGNLTIAP